MIVRLTPSTDTDPFGARYRVSSNGTVTSSISCAPTRRRERIDPTTST
jgi:hypothetical protein